MHCLCDSQKGQMLAGQIFTNFCLINFILGILMSKDRIAVQKLKILNLFILYIQHKFLELDNETTSQLKHTHPSGCQ
jgi:hypothetical protein